MDRAWAPPQPMSASRGGPWNLRLRLLKSRRLRGWKPERSPDCPGGPGAPAGADSRRAGTAPGTAPHRSARDRVEPQPHAPPRTLSPPQPPQHPWGPGDFKGVWGFGSREITGTERRLSLPRKRFFFDCLDPVPGRRERGVGAESGPSYTIHTHTRARTQTPHWRPPSFPCLFVRLF